MFTQKRSHFTPKSALIPIAVICGVFLTIVADSSTDLSSSIVSTEPAPKISQTKDSVFELYTERITTIQKATQTLTWELARLHEAKEWLQNSIDLKQHLLAATVTQNTLETEAESTTTVIKNLTQEITTLTKQLQDYDKKITEIYSNISAYGREIDDISSILD